MLGSVTRKQSSKGALAQARPNVVRIEKLPRHIQQLPVADALRWILEATHLTVYQALTRPRLARERFLTALKRERRVERKRRIDLATWRLEVRPR